MYPGSQVETSAGAERLSLSVSYCIKSRKFSSTIMSLPFALWRRRIALHFKKVKHSDLCQEELREEIMSLRRNMHSHTTDPLKYPLYSGEIRGVCVCVCASNSWFINKGKTKMLGTCVDESKPGS